MPARSPCRAINGFYLRIVPDKGWTRGTVWLADPGAEVSHARRSTRSR